MADATRICGRWLAVAATLLLAWTATGAEDAAPKRLATAQEAGVAEPQAAPRSRSKDAQADSHTPAPVKEATAEHFRGEITAVQGGAMVVKTASGKTVRLRLPDTVSVFALSKSSFANVDFGTYVGAAAVKLEEYSPIVRDSAVWLHKGFELRIIDEELRGIALGHKAWDLTADSIISHGWVDDIEIRVLSIKWGPTDYDETDVEIPREAQVLRMSLGDRSLIKPGVHVLAAGQKGGDGRYDAVFVFVGKDGIVPPL